jgi:hypothetical protein
VSKAPETGTNVHEAHAHTFVAVESRISMMAPTLLPTSAGARGRASTVAKGLAQSQETQHSRKRPSAVARGTVARLTARENHPTRKHHPQESDKMHLVMARTLVAPTNERVT